MIYETTMSWEFHWLAHSIDLYSQQWLDRSINDFDLSAMTLCMISNDTVNNDLIEASMTFDLSAMIAHSFMICQKACLTRSNSNRNVNIWSKKQICTWENEMSEIDCASSFDRASSMWTFANKIRLQSRDSQTCS